MRSAILRAVSLSVVAAAGLSCASQTDDATGAAPVLQPTRSAYEERAIAAGGVVTSVDADGLPRFIWADDQQHPAVRARTTDAAAREHVERFAAAYGITGAAVGAMRAEPIRRTERGDHLIRLVQELDGIEIYRGELKVVLRPDLSLVALSGTPSRVTGAKPADRAFRLTPGQAVSRALGDLYKTTVPDGLDSFDRPTEGADAWIDLPAVAAVRLAEPARARKVFYRDQDRLVAAYMTEFYSSRDQGTTSDAFRYFIAARDGRVLERRDLTAHEAFTYRAYARPVGTNTPTDGPQVDYNPHPAGIPDGSDPAFQDAILVTMESFKKQPAGVIDPWLAASAITTKGNNVDAYADLVEPDGFSAGDVRARTTGDRTFDYAYDHTLEPNANLVQQRASVTNLFYVVNWLHDYWYDSGFDEAAGNAQVRNFGRGGVGGDVLLAEAQDFGGLNNANMATPADGMSPRMQMYAWGGPESRSLEIDPGDLMLQTGYAVFGPQEFDTTGEVVLAVDGTPPTSDACQPLTNDVAGRIVLVDRGTCSFALKTLAAENAGAIGVIIANNVAAVPPPNLGNTDPPTIVTIPTLAITLEAGNTIKALLGSGTVTARMFRDTGTGRSGAIDNMVVAHEWGHYLHHRLSNCGSFQCAALSEGWADFNALHNSLQGIDDPDGTYALGIYAPRLIGDSGYFGIRRFPYSVDQTKNALSFRHIQNAEALPATPSQLNGAPNSEAHNAGEVWATMLWEAYVALQKNPNGRTFNQVKRAFANYVVLGLELAPIDATYTESRDALLAAVQLTRPSDLQVIAEAFAVRGAGTCAIGPPASASGDLTPVTESFATGSRLEIVSVAVDDSSNTCDADGLLDGGETGRVTVRVTNKGPTPLTDTMVTLSTTTPGVTFPGGNTAVIASLPPFAVRQVRIRIRLDASVTTTTTVDLNATADNAAACEPSVVDAQTFLVHLDEVANASATETVEVRNPPWEETGTLEGVWTRVTETAADHAWHGADSGTTGDVSLVSPPLQVSGTGIFTISFDHAYSFEFSPGAPATYWDGGVVEITTDGGTTWEDISAYDDPGYDGTITDTSGNPLAGRMAYGGTNPSYPATDPVTLNLGPGLGGQTVQIRFRIGTDAAAGAPGWTIDDIAFSGIDNTPFGVVVNDDGVCIP
jgi:large repetitive protein